MWFKSKKQIEDTQAIDPTNVKKSIDMKLQLNSLRLSYYADNKEPYTAYITYREQNVDYLKAIEREVRLNATTWAGMVQKVAEHLDSTEPLA